MKGSGLCVAKYSRMKIRWLLIVLLLLPALAEDPPNPQIAVLDPATGQVLGHYLMMRSMRERFEQGTEDPHFDSMDAFTHQFRDPSKLTSEDGKSNFSRGDSLTADKIFMGRLENGDRLVWFRKKGNQGPLKVVDTAGNQRTLVPSTGLGGAGWRMFFVPGLCAAGPYLLGEEPDGASCRRISDSKLLWHAPWKFGHCRWNLGAWYTGGALYVDTTRGLAKVDPASGKILWTWSDAVELTRVVQEPDGLLYVEFDYGPHERLYKPLTQAAVERYHWPAQKAEGLAGNYFWPRIIPYKDTYFGMTWYSPRRLTGDKTWLEQYLKSGTIALWELKNGKWSFIFDYEVKGQSEAELDALYAKYRFSPGMRKMLTTDSMATVYFDREGKMEPVP